MSLFLEDWELARVAFELPRGLDMLCQELHEASEGISPWTGCDRGRERCGEKKKDKKKECEQQGGVSTEGLRMIGF